MKKLNRTATLLFSTLFAVPVTGYTQSWSCKHDSHLREIQIQHETPDALPCSVVYKKPTEGIEEQTLWSASSDANYCEEKARALVEKHIGWGWTCEETKAETKAENNTDASDENNAADISTPAETTTNASDITDSPATDDSPAASAPTSQSMPEQH